MTIRSPRPAIRRCLAAPSRSTFFPRYYKYFSTQSFVYHGEAMRNHNHLLGSVDGVDGIETGFTRASGFYLVTSVHSGGRYLVADVMGGHSSFERDAHMRELISVHIKQASLKSTDWLSGTALVTGWSPLTRERAARLATRRQNHEERNRRGS